MKPITLPIELINALDYLTDADRGQTYTAIYAYIINGVMPSDTISPAARAIFETAKIILDPAITRRLAAQGRKIRKEHPMLEPKSKPTKPATAAPALEYKEPKVDEPLNHASDLSDHPHEDSDSPDNSWKYSSYVKDAHIIAPDPAMRHRLITRELARRHPGYSVFDYKTSGHYKLIG